MSGGIEAEDATPLDAALREIKEETQLTSQSVRYLCSGPTWSFYDKKLNYQWTVYPFAFYWPASAEAREPLVLGWEHEGYHWFKPQELKEEDLSGGILDSLRRVWPTGGLVGIDVLGRYCLGDGVDNGVDPRRDTETALAVFRGTVAGIDTEDPEWWTNVRLAAWHIWNYSDERIRGPLLARLVADLQKLEGLQRDAGLKERAAKALGQVDLGDSQAQLDAHQVFADLWESK